jgi:hypothetical protein
VHEFLTSVEREYRYYKGLGEAAMRQLTEEQFAHVAAADGNSIAVIVWHISGNLKSRFTDFLDSDGEKAWRDRDAEFDGRAVTQVALLEKWEEGWSVLFETLSKLSDRDLDKRVFIRGEEHTVVRALHRSLAHASYHVGQIVFLAKSLRGSTWHNLSMPKRKPSS